MSISALYVGNFKGIKDDQWIDIKPITIFIGRNSSGKSSCIHALTSLSQTIKLPNNNRPLILDDEYASVHLGRFIEVIHSKSYSDSIKLGIRLNEVPYIVQTGNTPEQLTGVGEAVYHFKCTKRTQDLYLTKAEITIGDYKYEAKRKSDNSFDIFSAKNSVKINCKLKDGFLFAQYLIESPVDFKNYMEFFPFYGFQAVVQSELQNSHYLGPFRQSPIRRYPTRGASPLEVGPQGESTATLLANEIIQSRARTHISQIASWLGAMELAKHLDVTRVGNSDLFEINITLNDGKHFPLADLGYGLSQILPVLTQCSFAQSSSTLLFEQPEIHLHPKSAKNLAKIFINTAISKKINIIAETHSPDLLAQLQSEIRDGNLDATKLSAYLVKREDEQSKLVKIDIDPDGDNYDVNWRYELTGIP